MKIKDKKAQYIKIYMEEMNLNYLNMTKEDFILMQIVIESSLDNDIKANKKEFKEFINLIIKDDNMMEDIKMNIRNTLRGENSE